MRQTGTYRQTGLGPEPYRTYIPHPLPPDPPLALAEEDFDLIERANRALGRLDGVTSLLPDSSLFIYFYVRKEAVLSSQIEETQSSLSDLLLFESDRRPGVPLSDVQEVSSYVKAMNYALHRIRKYEFPLSLRLIREAHALLLDKGRGKEKNPGQFRRSQNWLGGTGPGNAVFVPPPHHEVLPCMGALEKFLNDEPVRTRALLKAALAHVQFETIHPFLDGNGRIGRLLITLLLCAENVLEEPLLYLSLYFKQNRSRYYELLQGVREKGDWESWLRFFLTGVFETAEQAVKKSRTILDLFKEDRHEIEKMRRSSANVIRLHRLLQEKVLLSVRDATENLRITYPTARAAMEQLAKLGIVGEITGKRRGQIFCYRNYMDLLSD